jgi:hypothetical protein
MKHFGDECDCLFSFPRRFNRPAPAAGRNRYETEKELQQFSHKTGKIYKNSPLLHQSTDYQLIAFTNTTN